MPLYEYRCNDCGDTTETIQKFSDEPLSTCEICGGTLERLLSPPAIQFKGSGWYVTDYAHNNGRDPRSDESSAKTGEKKAADSSDAKSTSKAEKSTPSK